MALFLAICFLAVMVAMAIDFATGVRKARAMGIATRSKGFRMTSEKAGKYFLPMLCLACVDCLTVHFTVFPFLTSLMAAFNIFCEWRSIFESTHDKAEIRDAANTVQVIVKNKEDMAASLSELLEQMAKSGRPRAGKRHGRGKTYQSVDKGTGARRKARREAMMCGLLCCTTLLCCCKTTKTTLTEHSQVNEMVTSDSCAFRQLIATDSFDIRIGNIEYGDALCCIPDSKEMELSERQIPQKHGCRRYFRATNVELIRRRQVTATDVDTVSRRSNVAAVREAETKEVREPPSGISWRWLFAALFICLGVLVAMMAVVHAIRKSSK